MIEQIGVQPDRSGHGTSGLVKSNAANLSPQGENNDFSFFGKDGFTFFDFLDVINPLQHIPVISTLYRSITGDNIDPGSKIAGGTLFGGPLGAALSGLDVAVKHNTGRDIADHTVAFFNNSTRDQNVSPIKNAIRTGVQNDAVAWNQNSELTSQTREIKASQLSSTSPNPVQPNNRVTEDRFVAAGMSAIPIAKRAPEKDMQDPDYKARPMPDLGLLSKQNRPAPPREQFGINRKNITLNSNEQFKTSPTRTSGILNPHLLTPKYSPVSALGGNPEDEKVKAPNENIISLSSIVPQENSQIHSIKQTMENTKNGWIMDAMLEGLDKYKAASRLDPDRSGASRVSVSR